MSTLRAAAKRGGAQSNSRELRREKIGDGGAESAERKYRLHGAVGRIGRAVRGCERVGLKRCLVLHFIQIRCGCETRVANGFEALNLIAERARELTFYIERAAAHARDRAH